MALAPLIVMPVVLFGGFFANNSIALDWLGWLQYVSPIKYTSEAIVWSEYRHDYHGIRDNFTEFLDFKLGYWNCVLI